MENIKKAERIRWIDCAKTIAIMAVLVDHTNGILYTNQDIATASYFAVSLFVILSRMTSISVLRAERTFSYQLRKILKMFAEYAIANGVVLIWYNKCFDLKIWISHVLNFSLQGPYYFLLFFFQLVLVAPFLNYWCKYCDNRERKWLWHIGTLVVLGYLSSVFIRYTYVLPVHGGGQFLFGGTYLLLYYIGILFAQINLFHMGAKKRVILLVVSACTWVFWWRMMVSNKLPFDEWLSSYWGAGFNPPSVKFIVFALITLFMLYALFSLLEEYGRKIGEVITNGLAFIGKNTLYIFMYHLVCMNIVCILFPQIYNNIWVLRSVVFGSMLLLPVFVCWCVKKTGRIVKQYLVLDT